MLLQAPREVRGIFANETVGPRNLNTVWMQICKDLLFFVIVLISAVCCCTKLNTANFYWTDELNTFLDQYNLASCLQDSSLSTSPSNTGCICRHVSSLSLVSAAIHSTICQSLKISVRKDPQHKEQICIKYYVTNNNIFRPNQSIGVRCAPKPGRTTVLRRICRHKTP